MGIIGNCLLGLAAALALGACGKSDGQIRGVLDRTAGADFARSEIITSGTGIADGSSEMLVAIQLMNSNGSSVKLYKPTYEVVSGSGVIANECTTSNEHGVSTCIVKATQAGTKRLSVTNIKITLQKDIVFNAPASKPVLGLTVAGKTLQSGGATLSGSIGSGEPVLVNTVSGFKLYGGVQGNTISR